MERWRKPVIPIAIEESTSFVEVTTGGGVHVPNQMRKDVELVLEDEDVKRIASGHACIYCMEPFEEAYPKHCPVCNFPVKELQALWFVEKYNGWETPITPMREKIAALDEKDAKEAFDSSIERRQILVPRSI